MMTETESRRLGAQMHNELNTGPEIVWKCAAGMLVLTGLAVAGDWFDFIGKPDGEIIQAQAREASPRGDDHLNRHEEGRRAPPLPEISGNPASAAGEISTQAK